MIQRPASSVVLSAVRCLPWAVCCGLCAGHDAHAETTNRIAAVVNDEVITEGDIKAHMSALLQQGDSPAGVDAHSPQMRQAMLERIIDERLLIQAAKDAGLTVEPTEISQELQVLRGRLDTKAAYEQMLQEAGLTEEQLKTKIREKLFIQQVIDRQVRSKIVISPAELASLAASSPAPAVGAAPPSTSPTSQQAGEQVLADHILIRVNEERSEDRARAIAEDLSKRLANGADFSSMAQDYSEDPHAAEGGRLGWVRPGELLPALERAVAQLKPGQISEPIRTKLGFHLLKVEERKSVSDAEAMQSRQRLEQQLYANKFRQAMTSWLAELRQHAYIKLTNE